MLMLIKSLVNQKDIPDTKTCPNSFIFQFNRNCCADNIINKQKKKKKSFARFSFICTSDKPDLINRVPLCPKQYVVALCQSVSVTQEPTTSPCGVDEKAEWEYVMWILSRARLRLYCASVDGSHSRSQHLVSVNYYVQRVGVSGCVWVFLHMSTRVSVHPEKLC